MLSSKLAALASEVDVGVGSVIPAAMSWAEMREKDFFLQKFKMSGH